MPQNEVNTTRLTGNESDTAKLLASLCAKSQLNKDSSLLKNLPVRLKMPTMNNALVIMDRHTLRKVR